MAASLEQQLATSRASLAKTKATLADRDSVLSNAELRVTDLTGKVSALSHRVDSLTAITEAKTREAPSWYGLTPWMGVGWAVTVFGVIVAARMAIRGWRENANTAQRGWEASAKTARESQDHSQALEMDADREVFLDMLAESLRYFLWQLPFIVKQVKTDGFIGAGQFVHLDNAREGYDRNREKLILIPDPDLRRRIGRWFYGAKIWRSSVERYYVVGTKEHGASLGPVKWALSGSLEGVLKEGKAIYEALGFPQKYPNEEAYDALVRAEEEQAENVKDGGPDRA